MSRFVFCLLLFFALLAGCADTHTGGNGLLGSTEKSLLGSECSPGCVWSSWAVKSQVQVLTHYCDGEGCHCVEQGNIYNSCSLENVSSEETVSSRDTSRYSSSLGSAFADEAYYEASRRGTVGWCYNAVADAVERITGPFLWGAHAYQAADQFANSSYFYEVFSYDIYNLPEGAVVVWGKGTSRSGHISVSLGNGKEASDHIAQQMTYHYGGAPARVFFPR